MYDCIAIGEILVDFISDKKNEQGFPILNGNPGGGPPNFIVACQKLGLKTALIAKVGNDMFGERLIQSIAEYGVNVENVEIDDNYFTTLAFVSLAENGERSFSFSRKQSADLMLQPKELQIDKLKQTRALHFSSLSMVAEQAYSATLEAIKIAKQNNAYIHFDPNYRPSLWASEEHAREKITEALSYCDILKISEYELGFLVKEDNLTDIDKIKMAVKKIRTAYPNLALIHVTMGENGVLVTTSDDYIYHPAEKTEVVDTTGAGDAYGAAALCKFLMLDKGFNLTKDDLTALASFATRAAGLSVSRYGGIPSSAYLSELENK